MHGEPELMLEVGLCFRLNEGGPGTRLGAGAGALSGQGYRGDTEL